MKTRGSNDKGTNLTQRKKGRKEKGRGKLERRARILWEGEGSTPLRKRSGNRWSNKQTVEREKCLQS